MTQTFRGALGDLRIQHERLLGHLALIRDLAALGRRAGSLAELATGVARTLVHELGFEQAVVVLAPDGEAPFVVVGRFSQAERLGEGVEAVSPALIALADEVRDAAGAVRWGGEGVGAYRPLPPELASAAAIVGVPLALDDAGSGAVLAVQLAPATWDLESQRALELIGEIVAQVMTLAHVRLTMAGVQRRLEQEIGTARSALAERDAALRTHAGRIDELTTDLIASRRAKETFLGLMSHELRTPLSVILGYGSLLREEHAGPLLPEQRAYLDRMWTNGCHLGRLVDDLLFFVDADGARMRARRQPVDLPALVQEVAAAVPGLGAAGGPELEVSIPPAAARIESDPSLLRRVLFHLVSNAAKFTERGRITVAAGRAADRPATVILVADTGCGVPEPERARIFELFQQGDDSAARKRDGLGLGLNLVRACLRLLGGDFALRARPTGGTEVEITLPDAGAAAAAARDAAEPEVVPPLRARA